ncbi:MAG: helicase-related protein [Rhodovulum sp.]
MADEVGLGKTMVARGVIARTIEALQDHVPRIDVVYICSNGAIAKQNVSRLNVLGNERADVLPTRLTMLAVELGRAGGIRERGVNFFSLTPGTSLDLKQGGGMKAERALILRLIWDQLTDRRAVARMFQGYAGRKGWRETREWMARKPIEPQIAERFRAAIAAEPVLLQELEACAQAYKGLRENDRNLNRRREALVGRLRTILARESAQALEPDLIVLDEFQRFHNLLHGDSEAAELARELFDAVDPDGNQAKVLLLSATPYRMLTLRDDDTDAGDHYKEFLEVLRFLFGPERGARVCDELESEMRRFRAAMQGLPETRAHAAESKDRIETTLRQVIARTERVSETRERDAMVREIEVPVSVRSEDLIEARAVARVADAADAPGTVEYWKSAPYLLSFLRDYKLGERLEARKDSPGAMLLQALREAQGAQIDIEAVESWQAIPANNGRMRALMDLAFRDGLGCRLWMPPSLPYFGERIEASKLLVFSQWAMVPDAIAALLSYESERRMGMDRTGKEYSGKHVQLLKFRRAKGRLTGLRALPLVIPSPSLAQAADPLVIFRSQTSLPDAQSMREAAQDRLRPLARRLALRLAAPEAEDAESAEINRHEDAIPSEAVERAVTWDWAGPAALDMESEVFERWLGKRGLLSDVVREDGEEAWADHLQALHDAASADTLVGHPDEETILDHLADLALGSPAVCALRALHRIAPDLPMDHPAMLNAAAHVGMAFRGLFNQPETQALLRRDESGDAYWRTVLRYCAAHDLQSVLDEYVHVLLESEGLATRDPGDALAPLSQAIVGGLSLKPAQIDVKSYRAEKDHIRIEHGLTMRGRFATRLLQKSREDGGTQRTDMVRSAFNSPFRPFVLASTSVGQEGLDFHPYCHRIVHWNLPSNPVDLEQREGRVHRYKNHAVRLNLAAQHAHRLRTSDTCADPWSTMFAAAHASAGRAGDLEPFWLLDGETRIERYVLSLPFSRETRLLEWLKRSVALYRLAFGQPRQDDLLSFLDVADQRSDDLDLTTLQISLRPASTDPTENMPPGT